MHLPSESRAEMVDGGVAALRPAAAEPGSAPAPPVAAAVPAPPAPPAAALEDAMRRALALSLNGPPYGANPRVGAVLLAPDGSTLAEGWHHGAGTPHAEVDALSHLSTPALARGATAVVTLEPCNHTGRTGPCSDALIEAGVSAVYFAVADPGVASSGGAAHLEAHGVHTEAGLLASDVEQSIRPWLTAVRSRRPFVTLKWASSLDGRAAAADGSSQWITGADARHDVHERRSSVDAVVVGTGTVLADDPSLTARHPDGSLLAHQPIPVVVGERSIPLGTALSRHPESVRHYATHDLEKVLTDLFDSGVRSVFVEGGPTLASAFARAGLVDEFVVYLAPTLLGGPRLALGDLGVSTLPDARQLVIESVDVLGDDVRIVARPGPPVTTAPHTTRSAPQKETPHVHRNH